MRIITHWTAGVYLPNNLEMSDYHLGIIYDPISKKVFSEKWNNYTDVLAHTENRNTGSVGITLCGMLKAGPYNFGQCPINNAMIRELILSAAEICILKGIDPSNPKNCMTHAEAAELDGYGPSTTCERWDLSILKPLNKYETLDHKLVIKTGNYLRDEIIKVKQSLKTIRPFHKVSIK